MKARWGIAGALAAAALAAGAGERVIYRCTDARGAVTLQNLAPCPAGQRQQIIQVEVPPPLPTFVPAPTPAPPAEPAAAAEAPAVAGDAERPEPPAEPEPPPALYQCMRWDGERYLTEDAVPATRCRPLATVGIGGLPGLGAGQACEQVEDVCEAVPEEALCRAWENRMREAEFRWRVAPAAPGAHERQAAYEALARTYRGSACAR
ncbi:DUF4124 domain-containing protein [Luteimonas huabeiensis]|uniref:DUF4124 domain-containing protein n=1 Tax=Luteimonas huabeiensis TaxID=1244513 RepID=UPI0004B93D86|nr:DUF4124 domain-containing protein [Luteimonas huabeiensis]